MESATEDLEGRCALVTGGARRVGAAIVRTLHALGMNVVVHYRSSAEEAAALRDELESVRAGSVALASADLLDVGAMPALVAAAVDGFGGLDALVNNASTFYPTPIGVIDEASVREILGTNLVAPLLLTQAAAPHLRDRAGAIVNVADVYADRPLPGYSVYCAAKGGLVALTRALAVELGPRVRVNAVAPGAVLWPEHGEVDEAYKREVLEGTALERIGNPRDVAAAVAFLLRDARYTTGAVLPVDGGRSIFVR